LTPGMFVPLAVVPYIGRIGFRPRHTLPFLKRPATRGLVSTLSAPSVAFGLLARDRDSAPISSRYQHLRASPRRKSFGHLVVRNVTFGLSVRWYTARTHLKFMLDRVLDISPREGPCRRLCSSAAPVKDAQD
jgi:hypothetical protein